MVKIPLFNCQLCPTPCFNFEETGECPREMNLQPVSCCPDEDDYENTKSLYTCMTCDVKENCKFKETGTCVKENN